MNPKSEHKKAIKKLKAYRTKKRVRPAVKVYPDGREVCQANAAGHEEYVRRTWKMAERQGMKCRCGKCFWQCIPTFGHDEPRGMGGGRRDDRIELPDGTWINAAECWDCNSAKASRRSHDFFKPVPNKEKA